MNHELAPGVIQHFADLPEDEIQRQTDRVMAILRTESRKAEERLREIVRRLKSNRNTCIETTQNETKPFRR